jgi:hypothetical protein
LLSVSPIVCANSCVFVWLRCSPRLISVFVLVRLSGLLSSPPRLSRRLSPQDAGEPRTRRRSAGPAAPVVSDPAPDSLLPEGVPALPCEARIFAHNQFWIVPGGWLVYNVAAESLDAHCSCKTHKSPSNPCRLNRTRFGFKGKGKGNPARGRPLGLLLAWLRAGPSKRERDQHKHMVDPRRKAEGDDLWFTLDKRQVARQWAVDHGLIDLLGLERPLRVGEPIEPEGFA